MCECKGSFLQREPLCIPAQKGHFTGFHLSELLLKHSHNKTFIEFNSYTWVGFLNRKKGVIFLCFHKERKDPFVLVPFSYSEWAWSGQRDQKCTVSKEMLFRQRQITNKQKINCHIQGWGLFKDADFSLTVPFLKPKGTNFITTNSIQ